MPDSQSEFIENSTRCHCVNKSNSKMHRSLLPNQFEYYKNHNVFSNVSMEEFKTRSAQKYAHQEFFVRTTTAWTSGSRICCDYN